jgi:hypothetical protein
MLYAHRTAGSHRESGLFATASLHAGLFVGGNDKVGREERDSLPPAFIEVQDASRLGYEIWVAGKSSCGAAKDVEHLHSANATG